MAAINWTTILYNLIFSIGGVGSVFWLAFRRAVHHVIQEANETKETLAIVKHEVTPNSGSSIKDHVNANSARLERVEHQVDAIMKILMERAHD